ncbi:GNAT family N-acetyltransferase [Actinokineospora diospyrosa]
MTTVRVVGVADLDVVVELIAEHAEYERAAPPAAGLGERLGGLLFGPLARLRCFVAETDQGVVGYATCVAEVSTWDGGEYLHMDCLYLRPGARGRGVGQLLFEAVREQAKVLGLKEIQWQTPGWNEGAVRFYGRLGATAVEKVRFTLSG